MRSIIKTFAEQYAPGGLDHAWVGETKFHACFDHPAEVVEGIHVVIWGMHVLEIFQFLLLDHIEHMHEDILLVFKILIETSFCNAAVFDNAICGSVLQTVFGKFFHGGVHDRFAFFFGEVEKSLFGHKNVISMSAWNAWLYKVSDQSQFWMNLRFLSCILP